MPDMKTRVVALGKTPVRLDMVLDVYGDLLGLEVDKSYYATKFNGAPAYMVQQLPADPIPQAGHQIDELEFSLPKDGLVIFAWSAGSSVVVISQQL